MKVEEMLELEKEFDEKFLVDGHRFGDHVKWTDVFNWCISNIKVGKSFERAFYSACDKTEQLINDRKIAYDLIAKLSEIVENDNFNSLYDEIGDLVIQDQLNNGASVSLHLNKLTEEVGEFAQAINKTLGIKKHHKDDNEETIKDNIAEEAADAIQIISGICKLNGITSEQLLKKLGEKNDAYREFIILKSTK